ncbi:hypothetical protein [Microbacterium sp.]|uniref:hypothetical protein n=1 Tax=Microbacterium sp. TaxID=51671 RepID=UPI0028112588|nr:hypothetical protein [Microbacterium sp.]
MLVVLAALSSLGGIVVVGAAVLWRLLDRRRLPMIVKGLAMLVGFGLTGALLLSAASAIWP